MKKIVLLIAVIAMVFANAAIADVGTTVSGNYTTDQHWTKAGHPYHLSDMVKIMPGATLTIDPGVVVATYKVGPGEREGTLAILRGAKIFVNGTPEEPVIMTSAEDVATWSGSSVTRSGTAAPGYPSGYVTSIDTMGDPKTGTWRAKCLEWGSLAILGNAYISASHYKNKECTWLEDTDGDQVWDVNHVNVAWPSGNNKRKMEGTTFEYPGDTTVLYGGDDDDDDSGSISYLSIRYGGKVIVDTDELNGMSLGGVGRGTDIHHVEIMNNVDDGIELWGGTVNLEYLNIWNIGDDSLDFDQGWRGSAKYGLIVQGYSATDKDQGSGIGDNCFEMDGAEDANAQPVTTVRIENFTCVGQPGTATHNGSDGGTAWRDNARVQFDRCVWMNLDGQLITFDCQDKDGADGYDGDGNDSTKGRDNVPPDGTMNWVQHWTTSYNDWKAGAYADPFAWGIDCNSLYGPYVSIDPAGKLCQITNSVVYGSTANNSSMYNEYNTLSGEGANFSGNVTNAAAMPIQGLTYSGTPHTWNDSKEGWLSIAAVTSINPCAAGDALTLGAGGFTGCHNWLEGWTAADAFGLTDTSNNSRAGDVNCDGKVDLVDMAEMAIDYPYSY